MRTLLVAIVLASLLSASTIADPNDLWGGLLVAHDVPELPYSSAPPPDGWCEAYGAHAIQGLEQVIASIHTAGVQPAVWFVLAAWELEEKTWCEVDLGFGGFDAAAFAFEIAAPCFPQTGIEVSTAGWPGPNEGTDFAATGEPWHGNWAPVYAFGGYAYGYTGRATRIGLGPNPATSAIGFRNCSPAYPEFFEVREPQRGALGINTAGIVPVFPLPGQPGACCSCYDPCTYISEEECVAAHGLWMGPLVPCEPDPCLVYGVCCVGGIGELMTAEACKLIHGVFHPGAT